MVEVPTSNGGKHFKLEIRFFNFDGARENFKLKFNTTSVPVPLL